MMHRSTNPIQAPKSTFRIRWADLAAFAGVAAISVVSTLTVVNVFLGPATSPAEPTTPACVTEDDTNCFWDATVQGNGFGNSFYTDAAGQTYYLPVGVTDTPEYRKLAECTKQFRGLSRDAMALSTDLAGQWAGSEFGTATYGEWVITDNLQPMQDRYDYLLTTFCPED